MGYRKTKGYGTLRNFSQDISQIINERDDLLIMFEMQQLKTALYAALFFNNMDGNDELIEKLQNQIKENDNALIGAYDGFCYSSTRTYAEYRSLDEMYVQGILTLIEYEKCKSYIL